nr:DUF4197 domain-containing protein [Saprospiraceae bacterium]
MKNIPFLLLIVSFTLFWSCSDLQRILDETTDRPLSTEEVALGLKEALNVGVDHGVSLLSARDGFLKSNYKILLPPEARKITDRLQGVPGFSNVEEIIIERINRSAEDAVGRAAPIFGQAIRSMTVQDAWGILRGENDAATSYLHERTSTELYNEFNPVIVDALNKYEALDYWESTVNAYNSLPFVEQLNPRLDDYITHRALDALFDRIAIEEAEIREDVEKRTTELLRRVFERQDG